MSKKVCLDLFSGTGSATKYFRNSEEWEVYGVDISPDREEDFSMDIFEFEIGMLDVERIDFVWASPPCKSFSLAGGGYWSKKSERLRLPKNEKAFRGVSMVFKALQLIRESNPEFWYLENPRGGLRAILGEPQHDSRREMDKNLKYDEKKDSNYPGTVTYCQFGDDRMKPTDLWGRHPDEMRYPFCGNGMDCHVSAPRGSDTGTQGRGSSSDRWRLPDNLAHHVYDVVNRAIDEE